MDSSLPAAAGQAVAHDTIVIERRFEAPPAEVFAAWADPAAKEAWFACHEDWEPAGYSLDFRVDGVEVNRAVPPGEPMHVYEARYLDIVPGSRFVLAYTMTLGETRISASLLTVEVRPDGAATRLILTEQVAVLDDRYPASGREQGWGQILERLRAALAPAAAVH